MKTLLTRNLFVSTVLSAAFAPMLFSSCQDEDFGYTAEQIAYAKNFTQVYGEIPADKSWDMSSDANWVDPAHTSTRAHNSFQSEPTSYLPSNAYGVPTEYKNAYYDVPGKLLTWLSRHLIEGNDNRYLGSDFVLKLPNNNFAIIPIFQGNSAIMSELKVKINEYKATTVWTKSQYMMAQDSTETSFRELGYFDGWDNWETYQAAPSTKHAASTIKAQYVRTKPIVFYKDNISTSTEDIYMYLSLKNIGKLKLENGNEWDANNTWTTVGDNITSIHSDKNMLALNLPWDVRLDVEQHLPFISSLGKNPSQMLVIGCEDANGSSSDHDVNDVVFLIVGYPDVPIVVPTTKTIKKRYMCEDLGATNDFDFNDVVVDVSQTKSYTINTSGNKNYVSDTSDTGVEITGISEGTVVKQTAKIAHVCGTLPLQVRVGNYLFPWINDPTDLDATRKDLMGNGWVLSGDTWTSSARTRAKYEVRDEGWNPNEERIISGWDPEANNIEVYVQWPADWKTKPSNAVLLTENQPEGYTNDYLTKNNPYNSGTSSEQGIEFLDLIKPDHYVAVSVFPKKGTIPYIIAVDQDVHWMKECRNIPEQWLIDGKFQNTDDVAGVGSGAYYENYDSENQRAVIWTGELTGEKYITALNFIKGSAEHNGMVEALDAPFNYNTINVITDVLTDNGQEKMGIIGLLQSNWSLLSDDGSDGYYCENVVGGQRCASVVLTDAQISNLKANGFLLTSRSDKQKIREVTLSKTTSYYDVSLTEPALSQAGKPTGSISAHDRERLRAIEASGRRIPFANARYASNENLVLTAVPASGYQFDKWSDGNTSNPRTINSTANLTAVFRLMDVPTATVALTKDMIYEWNEAGNNAYIVFQGWDSNKNAAWEEDIKTTGASIIYGNLWGHYRNYVDLPNANYLVAVVNSGNPEFHFNKQLGTGDHADYTGERIIVNENHENCIVIGDSYPKTYVIDVKAIREKYGYVHLNTIGAPYDQTANIKSVMVDDASSNIRSKWEEIKSKSVNAATDLTLSDFFEWNGDAKESIIKGHIDENYVWHNSSSDQTDNNGQVVFGHKGSHVYYYSDISAGKVLVVTAPADGGELFLQFNKKYDANNQYPYYAPGINVSPRDDRDVCAVVKSGDNYQYVIDLEAIKTEKSLSFLHLNAINVSWNGNNQTYISSVKIDNKESRVVNNYLRIQAVGTWTNLGIDMYHQYTDITGNSISATTDFGAEYNVGKSDINIYGHGSVPANCYAILDGYTILKLEVEEGEPRLLFNRKTEGNDFIEITPSNENKDWIYKVDNTYYVMLWPIQEIMKENIRLNVIKGNNNQPAKVTSIQVGKP